MRGYREKSRAVCTAPGSAERKQRTADGCDEDGVRERRMQMAGRTAQGWQKTGKRAVGRAQATEDRGQVMGGRADGKAGAGQRSERGAVGSAVDRVGRALQVGVTYGRAEGGHRGNDN